MADSSWLWAVFTLIAAAAQTVRNAAQRELTGKLGTVGATHVRFLFGCPFALVFLGALLATGGTLPRPTLSFLPWLFAGALMQIAATALMLAAMGERSFVVTIAYIKTEPVQVALFGLIFLGDAVTPLMAMAIVIATAGVILMSLKGGTAGSAMGAGWRSTALGLSAGACFALSAIGFRGAILNLHDQSYAMAATFTMAAGLVVQSVLPLAQGTAIVPVITSLNVQLGAGSGAFCEVHAVPAWNCFCASLYSTKFAFPCRFPVFWLTSAMMPAKLGVETDVPPMPRNWKPVAPFLHDKEAVMDLSSASHTT